ncbi:MAG: sigma-70 family RNA polymerase sigma factor, partial [Myxococcota bacterium]
MSTAQISLVDRYRRSLGTITALDPSEELALAQSFREGDNSAGTRLIESSLPFVLRIAREYRRWGIPLEDLIQQGNLGLLKAASKFDPQKECRLVTYAAYWIRAEIRDYVVRSYRIVRLGTTRTERRAMRAFRRKGVESAEELAESSGMPTARAEKLLPILMQSDMSLNQRYADLPAAIDRLESEGQSPEQEAARKETIEGVREALDKALVALTEREQRIVNARLLNEDPKTLQQLGNEMGVSKERVRQLEERAR